MELTYHYIGGGEDLADAFRVRREVFIAEQGVAPEEEYDGLDKSCIHAAAYDGKDPVAAGRLRKVGEGVYKIERICVLKSYRGRGAGRGIVRALEREASRLGAQRAILNSQTHAETFYRAMGYQTVSGVFDEAGIPHVAMEKEL